MTNFEYFWTEDQLDRLKKAYTSGGGLGRAAEVIPEKERGTIAAKASRLGITVSKPRRIVDLGGFGNSSGNSGNSGASGGFGNS